MRSRPHSRRHPRTRTIVLDIEIGQQRQERAELSGGVCGSGERGPRRGEELREAQRRPEHGVYGGPMAAMRFEVGGAVGSGEIVRLEHVMFEPVWGWSVGGRCKLAFGERRSATSGNNNTSGTLSKPHNSSAVLHNTSNDTGSFK